MMNDCWIPKELKCCFLAENNEHGEGAVAALKYLLNHSRDCESYVYKTTPLDLVIWTSDVMEMLFFPLEFCDKYWQEHLEEIETVLNRAQEILWQIAPNDYTFGHVMSDRESGGVDFVELGQKLNLFYSVLYMYKKDWESAFDQLQILLDGSKRNISYLVQTEEAEKYASQTDRSDFHYPGMDIWAPLDWLSREWLEEGFMPLFVDIYERYAKFLAVLVDAPGVQSRESCEKIHKKAELRLRETVEQILESIEDEEQLEGSEANSFFLAQKDFYVKVDRESRERLAGQQEADETTMSYKQSWSAFTKKLSELLKEYDLPVVLPLQDGQEMECAVVSIEEHMTGKIRERVILIREKSDRALGGDIVSDEWIDLPFH